MTEELQRLENGVLARRQLKSESYIDRDKLYTHSSSFWIRPDTEVESLSAKYDGSLPIKIEPKA